MNPKINQEQEVEKEFSNVHLATYQNNTEKPIHKGNTRNIDDPNIERVISGEELKRMKFAVLDFSNGWEKFMQNPAKNMKIGISGAPKNGKTFGSCQFAAYLTNFGNILYNFVDQGYNYSTQEIWKQTGLMENQKAQLYNTRSLDALEKQCATGKFQFVFIDMINTFIHRTKLKPHEFEDRFIKKYPDISFILIFEVTKQGKFKGDQTWMHVVDAIVEVKDFLMENTGRYGNGYHIIWEKEFKKRNPKKYAELFPTEETNSSSVVYV